MKKYSYFILLLAISVITASCNKDEGLGGSSTLEGYVYNVIHKDDNFSFSIDTIPAVKEDVFLRFGHEGYFGDDVETDHTGMYRFNYLRKGNYSVYALSQYADDRQEAVIKEVHVGSGVNKVEDIYIHTGKAYGTAMVKGSVKALYYDKGRKVDEGPAIEKRVFINHYGEETHFDDVRVGDQGVFIFQKLLPGKYEIWVTTEDPETEKLTSVKQLIEIDEWGKIYELPKIFTVIITV
ncbi:hypothetical protein [Parabacteroides sp. PF5-9]|uniref:hypothetical protein n=1 Tax=Parabacteroides sp. PF5-9 TaxID=1742404 RepID=UPI002476AB6F|nr:hypothetical protein [Parabacteroides sp. PF5-9]MDH6356512.1 hypothetical protein [Parabacteroides sp. PF5-9]